MGLCEGDPHRRWGEESVLQGNWQHGKAQQVSSQADVQKSKHFRTPRLTYFCRTAASLMHKYGAHGATDVSKFGLLGHAAGLAKAQTSEVCFHTISLGADGANWSSLQVSFVIHNLPVLAHMERLSSALEKERGQPWGLAQGGSNFLGLFFCQHCNCLP